MTDSELATWQTLCDQATPGPWRWWTSCSFRRLSSDATGKDGDVLHGTIQLSDGHTDVACSDEDKAFIAESRTALPACIDELRRSRAREADAAIDITNVRRLAAVTERRLAETQRSLDEARAEAGRLTKRLAAYEPPLDEDDDPDASDEDEVSGRKWDNGGTDG